MFDFNSQRGFLPVLLCNFLMGQPTFCTDSDGGIRMRLMSYPSKDDHLIVRMPYNEYLDSFPRLFFVLS